MQTSNQANRAMRDAPVGHVWEEKLTNAMGTVRVPQYATIRVRATGATTVTVDGVLAMTMSAGEIELFCVGNGNPADSNKTVDVVIAGAAAFVQVARDQDRRA